MSADAAHTHHPAADKAVEFKGYAAFTAKGPVKAYSYNPPKLSGDFVEIAIDCCGICGSDIHTIDSGWGPSNYPVIVGHEIVGKITAVGADVKSLAVGDRVGVGAQCGSCMGKLGKSCAECESGWQQHCRNKLIWTYNTKYPDGQVSQGGYADNVRCQKDFVFKIPDKISSEEAAPLMCAGVTTYAPLARSLTKPGMKVGVIGVGGLGHLGIMFASKLQDGKCEVTAISHNSKKKDDALKMGATKFLDTSDKEQLKDYFRYFDYVLCTANGEGQDYTTWLSTIALGGTFCTVGLPEDPMPIGAFSLTSAQVHFTGSNIGSIKEIEDMLAFAADKNIRPIIEKFPMDKANDGIQHVRDGKVRYRVVLTNPTKA